VPVIGYVREREGKPHAVEGHWRRIDLMGEAQTWHLPDGEKIIVRPTADDGVWERVRIRRRTGDEPAGLLANRGVKVTRSRTEVQEAIGARDMLVAGAHAEFETAMLRSHGGMQQVNALGPRSRMAGSMRVNTKARGATVFERNIRRLGRRQRAGADT
jgi:hypothetical protein